MLICDGHAHFYPRYDLARALDCLTSNLRRMAPVGDVPPVLTACLAERAGHSIFMDAEWPVRAGRYEIQPGVEDANLTVKRAGDLVAHLIMGRQFVAAERIEVLGLALAAAGDWDGLPARDIIARVRDAGGLPVLPWAPGKWFFSRGRLVADLVNSRQGGGEAVPRNNDSNARVDGVAVPDLWLGDTALRPWFWPLPRFAAAAGANAPAWIPGSDPLPLRGEEARLGSYGFIYAGEFDAERPVSALRDLLRRHAGELVPAGRRAGACSIARRIMLNYIQRLM